VLDHRQLDPGQVEHLPAFLADDRRVLQTVAAAAAELQSMDPNLIRIRALHQPNPRSPGCFPGLRPEARRNDRGGGFTNTSELGGFEEFCEFFPNRASNCEIRRPSSSFAARNAAITSSWRASSADSSALDSPARDEAPDDPTDTAPHCGGSRKKNRQHPPKVLTPASVPTNPNLIKPTRRGPEWLHFDLKNTLG